MAARPHYRGRLELTWTNKDECLLATEGGGYEWVPAFDHRVAEVRLLHDAGQVGEVSDRRAGDNLLIRGDAMNALNSLTTLPEFRKELLGKVKLVYIDPPFNTQQAFEHYDDALEHSVWLTMMRDRLKLLKKLLHKDGCIWVHVDDDEHAYLKVLLDEEFGRDRFVATVIWRKVDSSRNDADRFSRDHDTLVVYSRNPGWQPKEEARPEEMNAHYSNPDNDPDGPWYGGGDKSSPKPRPNLRYPVVNGRPWPKDKPIPKKAVVIEPPKNGWRWAPSRMNEEIDEGLIVFNEDKTKLYRKRYLKDQGGVPPSTLWDDVNITHHNRGAKNELKKLFGKSASEVFDTPKPERLLRRIITLTTGPGDLVLDCFLGSGTTAAVAQKLGRRWVGIERSRENIESFTYPRLCMVVDGDDQGGISEEQGWNGGGGFRVLDVAPSMFAEDEGVVVIADWASNGKLAEVTAAQFGFKYEPNPPFSGNKGNQQLAIVDGNVNVEVLKLLTGALSQDERLFLCGTSVDLDAEGWLKEHHPGSRTVQIPASILAEYHVEHRWQVPLPVENDEAIEDQVEQATAQS
jgi:adenine-specific DNA-methyltransferase